MSQALDLAMMELLSSLRHPGFYWAGVLFVHPVTDDAEEALVRLLVEPSVSEWDGRVDGTRYRTHHGTLPCGLPVRVTRMVSKVAR